jgi:Na+/H+ antiporter NhaA
VLLAATFVALAWANSPWQGAYDTLWGTQLSVRLGTLSLAEDLRHWVNDGLMAIFFFVVGLEIKRELSAGELKEIRRAALPIIGALGGMVVPALLYLLVNSGGDGGSGWGIPMATDIAFALGVLALFGRRVPSSLRVFLLSLAIVDDVGAIVVIAVFYSGGIEFAPLVLACTCLAIVVVMRSAGVWWVPAYIVIGLGTWVATYESGVHATIAGVALGLLAPARAQDSSALDGIALDPRGGTEPTPAAVRSVSSRAGASVSVVERLEHVLHPWASFVIVPIFALANAGISLTREGVAGAATSPITAGVVIGLVVGKLSGIAGFTWCAHRLGLAVLPDGVGWGHLSAVAAVAGIGFTVSIFITSLAFTDPRLIDEAKFGVLVASVLATVLGALLLRVADRDRPVSNGSQP